jgi:signal transduction histidine kinase
VNPVRNSAILLVIAGSALLNGLNLDTIPPWRQLVFVVLAVLAYLHGRHLPVPRGWLLLTVVAIPGLVAAVPDFWTGAGALSALGLFVVLPWLAGRFRRQQAELVVASQERVTRLEREQQLLAERVALEERARIAADMHDSLGHELALIALRAGGLELAAGMTDRNQQAAAELRASAVTATDRLRQTIGLLRASGTVPSKPADEPVEDLVGRARAAGMAVDLQHTAHQPGAPATMPPLVDRAVHRVVQESLTNAARHAPGADVLVRIERTVEAVTVTVHNTPGAASAPPRGGNGSGLDGLCERVRLHGGTLSAGPLAGGFTVTARLPLDQGGNR